MNSSHFTIFDMLRNYHILVKDERAQDLAFEDVRPQGWGQNIGGVLFLDEAYDLNPKNDPQASIIWTIYMRST